MLLIPAGQRLALGCTIDDMIGFAEQAAIDNPTFLDQTPTAQLSDMMLVALRSVPIRTAAATNPRAINWERLFQFAEFLLPFLIQLLKQRDQVFTPTPRSAGT
jgi:hypothetical protein